MKKRTGSNRIYGRILCLFAALLLLSACGKKQPAEADISGRAELSSSSANGAGDVSAAAGTVGNSMDGNAASDASRAGEESAQGGQSMDAEGMQNGQDAETDATDDGQNVKNEGARGGEQAGGSESGQDWETGVVRNGQNPDIGDSQGGRNVGTEGMQDGQNAGADDAAGMQDEGSTQQYGAHGAPQPRVAGATPYGSHGALSVSGTQLVDTYGAPYQLRGVSTHGLAWFPQYVNQAAFRTMRDEWGVNAVRLAMYTAEYGGYCVGDANNRNNLKQLVYDGVDAATELGMYVIVDWHVLNDRDPNTYVDQAVAFFRETAERYASYENVIYEICNEPNGGVSWQTIKKYAEQVIPVIREQDGDAIIIVGTPTWSQDVDQAAANPITGYENIMYALHFYADTHRDSLRQKMVNAIGAGLPVFVSEFGICDASGSGAVNAAEADKWIGAMDENGVSYCIWNLSNKAETSALLRTSTTATSGWSYEDLSESGKWFVDMMGADHAAFGSSGGGTSPNGGNGSNGSGISSNGGNGSIGGGTSPSGGNGSDGGGTSPNGGSGNTGNGANANGAGGTAQSVTSDAAGSLQATVSLANSWETDGKRYYQYNLELSNASGAKINGWTCEITFDHHVSVSQSWCGSVSVSGSGVTITPESYNAVIEAGAAQGNVGFILETDSMLTVTGVSCR